ncbi:uncharacterized protein LOC110853751 isoform X2 [Folsomia candida]|uniref:uncharacterized protein LOC110853751 isoform X2 n=1 Tax=Folsomia candida TaxID=158441 RepID=UPI0016054CAD|nr:uncharacterized protein LOC110853751 isoform X2 [Folsomia candida]
MESLTTLMLCTSQSLFLMAIYRFSSLEFELDPSSSTPFRPRNLGPSEFTSLEGFALCWMVLRGLTDVYMSTNFLVCASQKTQSKLYSSWSRFALVTMLIDSLFMLLLVRNETYLGMEMFALVIDAVIKLVITCICLNLRRNLGEGEEHKPLLSGFTNSKKGRTMC